MAYVTEDERVISIIWSMHIKEITREEAREEIEQLCFQDWEVVEALNMEPKQPRQIGKGWAN